jgi:wyosine [tRNA(Phe)-imidazoG37] synthetase (radical SAM superfamily)
MDKLRDREFDFSSKLRQESTIARLREYILWRRNSINQKPPNYGPISINLDLTSACNFSCPHCVDSKIINTGEYLRLEDIKQTINVLHSHGLLSVILLGGGEPALHKHFEEIVRYIKGTGLELGVVTNGSRLDKVARVAELLGEKDWVRISIDAAKEDTFKKLHRPKNHVTLNHILHKAREIKEINPLVSIGYSFVILWEGMEINGNALTRNTDEITGAVELAREYSFDFISFKPCLIRLEDSQKESLLDKVDREREERIVEEIKINLHKAKDIVDGGIKILESVNLQAMMSKEVNQLKRQPKRCHMQFFRTVVAPSGIFHCPAFRGLEKAKIAASDGYVTKSNFEESLEAIARSISTFDAENECKVVGCFYHHVNWWLENFTNSGRDIDEIETVGDDNFFL